MAGLKKGDRVTAIQDRIAPERKEYLLAKDAPVDPDKHSIIEVRTLEGQKTHVWTDSLEPLPEPDTAPPREGDRVRLSYEGVVRRVRGASITLGLDSAGVRTLIAPDATSVEVLERKPEPEPEPYRVGTLVRTAGGVAVRTGKDDTWMWVETGLESGMLTDGVVRDVLERGSHPGELLYEPERK